MFWIFFRPSREQLADWHHDKRLRPLRRAVSLATPEGRAIAAEYLGDLRDKDALKALSSALLKDKVAAVRRSAAQSLGRIGPEALSALSQALRKDSDVLVRETAASSLGLLKEKSAAPALEEAFLTDTKATVRATCARALGQIGAEQSIPKLRAALLAGHPLLTEGAAAALEMLSYGPKLEGRERAAYLIGLSRFIEASDADNSILDLLLLRAALARDGSAMPDGLLDAICRIVSPDAVPFLGHRLHSLRRVLSGGPVPEVYAKFKKEAQMIETALLTVNNKEAQDFLAGYGV
jgi:HEAT repeat protein